MPVPIAAQGSLCDSGQHPHIRGAVGDREHQLRSRGPREHHIGVRGVRCGEDESVASAEKRRTLLTRLPIVHRHLGVRVERVPQGRGDRGSDGKARRRVGMFACGGGGRGEVGASIRVVAVLHGGRVHLEPRYPLEDGDTCAPREVRLGCGGRQ